MVLQALTRLGERHQTQKNALVLEQEQRCGVAASMTTTMNIEKERVFVAKRELLDD